MSFIVSSGILYDNMAFISLIQMQVKTSIFSLDYIHQICSIVHCHQPFVFWSNQTLVEVEKQQPKSASFDIINVGLVELCHCLYY